MSNLPFFSLFYRYRPDPEQIDSRTKYFSPRLGRTMNFSPRLGRELAYGEHQLTIDWPVGLVVRDPDC